MQKRLEAREDVGKTDHFYKSLFHVRKKPFPKFSYYCYFVWFSVFKRTCEISLIKSGAAGFSIHVVT